MKKTMISIIVILIAAANSYARVDNGAQLIPKFDEFDQALNGGEGYSKSTNEDGVLSWAECYLLEAYLDMYDVTKDKKYIQKFVLQSQRVYGHTDKNLHISDYKARIRTGWSATKYSIEKKRVHYIIDNSMILYPFARFCFLVKVDNSLKTYKDLANKYEMLVKDAIAEFDAQWKLDSQNGAGTYVFEGDEPLAPYVLSSPMPLNWPLALGRVIIVMYKITGDESYLMKAKGIAKYFKNNLIETGNGSYIWGYRPDIKHSRVEDFSHGGIDVAFAVEAFSSNILFNLADIKKFAKTLAFCKKGKKFSVNIDGTGDDGTKAVYSDTCGIWMDLAAADCSVYQPIHNYIVDRMEGRHQLHPELMLGIAKLVKYDSKCSLQ